MNFQPFQQLPHFLNLVSLGLLAGMRTIRTPLFGLKPNLHPGAVALKNITTEGLEQCLNV